MRAVSDRFFSGSPYEPEVGFCRALRDADRVLVAGTAPIADDGAPFAPGDAYAQARRCLEIIGRAVVALGGGLPDVVRTRIYLTSAASWQAVARAHGEVFRDHPPVSTFVVVAGLLDPAWLVEIEAEASVKRES